jgi:hypothetical protein
MKLTFKTFSCHLFHGLHIYLCISDNSAHGDDGAGGNNADAEQNDGDNNAADSNNEDDGDDVAMSDSDDDSDDSDDNSNDDDSDDDDVDPAVISLLDRITNTNDLHDYLFG